MDDDATFVVRIPKPWIRLGLVALVTALIVAPLTAVAGHLFGDVPDSNTFHDDISWLADTGITRGCNPPANDQFCPDDPVTRAQMAAFLHRFAGELSPRAAYAAVEDAPDGSDYSLPVEITAPAPGVVLTHGTVDGYAGPDALYRCAIHLNGDAIPGSRMDARLDGDTNYEENCTTGGGIAVEAGTHTFALDVSLIDEDTSLYRAYVWAMWVPFDGAGEVPTPTPVDDLATAADEKPQGG